MEINGKYTFGVTFDREWTIKLIEVLEEWGTEDVNLDVADNKETILKQLKLIQWENG